MQTIAVKAPDGTTLAAQDWGAREGREILFIHGFSQAHLSWLRQANDADAAQVIPHGDLRPARPWHVRQAGREGALRRRQDLGRRHRRGDRRRRNEAAGAGGLVLRRPRYRRLPAHARRIENRRHQLRQRPHRDRAGDVRPGPAELSQHAVGGPRRQHHRHARLPARLFRAAADRRRVRVHACDSTWWCRPMCVAIS